MSAGWYCPVEGCRIDIKDGRWDHACRHEHLHKPPYVVGEDRRPEMVPA